MKQFTLVVAVALSLASPSFAALDDYGTKSVTTGAYCKDITRGEATAAITISNTWTGTVTFQRADGRLTPGTPQTAWAFNVSTRAWVQSTTANGTFLVPISGASQVCTSFAPGSGTVTTFTDLSLATFPNMLVAVGGPLADGASATGVNPLFEGYGFNGTVLTPRYCDKTIAFTTQGTTSVVKQIAEVASQHIYVCGWMLFASTATTGIDVTWWSGSGASCGSGSNAAIGGKFITTPTTAPTSPNSTFGITNPAVRMTLAAGDALCTKQSSTTNSTTLTGTIWYTQTP